MKKSFLLGIGLSLCFTLAACGEQPSNTPASSSSAASSSISSSSSADSSQPAATPSSLATFGSSHEAFLEAIKPSIQNQYPTLFSEEPSVQEHDASEVTPAAMSYSYPVGNSGALVLFDEKDSQELYEVFLSFQVGKEDETSIQQIGFIQGILFSALEPDETMRQQIDQQLNTSNISEDAVTLASGTVADWTYLVDGTSISLMVTAK